MPESQLEKENNELTGLLNRARIRFPWDLTLEQARGLIDYICVKLPGSAKCFYSQYMEILHSADKKQLTKKEGITTLSGQIFHEAEKKAVSSFALKPSDRDNSRLSSILFELKDEDSKLEDYRPEVLQLWDDVKKIVGDYFIDNAE